MTIEAFDLAAARQCALLFLAVSGDFSLQHARALCAGSDGPVVIDNSSAFRLCADVPLVVPEINAHVLQGQGQGQGGRAPPPKLIANPNCTTAIAAVVLWPLHVKYGIRRVIMSTYQAASGAGEQGMAELQEGAREVLEGRVSGTATCSVCMWRVICDVHSMLTPPVLSVLSTQPPTPCVFQHVLPFNLIPHIDAFLPNGYTKEEMKVSAGCCVLGVLHVLCVSCVCPVCLTYPPPPPPPPRRWHMRRARSSG